jgi:hypothetical protein
MNLNESYSRVQEGKHLTDIFPLKEWFEKRRCLFAVLFSFALEHAYRKVQANQEPEIN